MKDKRNWKLITLSAVAIILIGGLWYLNYHFLVENNDRGTLGDMFGVVNSLFSGLAFAGIIITIYLQGIEMRDTREVLKRTAEAQEESEKAMTQQAENLKLSAKLSALTTLVNHYETMRQRAKHEAFLKQDYMTYEEKKENFIKQIEKINALVGIE